MRALFVAVFVIASSGLAAAQQGEIVFTPPNGRPTVLREANDQQVVVTLVPLRTSVVRQAGTLTADRVTMNAKEITPQVKGKDAVVDVDTNVVRFSDGTQVSANFGWRWPAR